MAYCQREQVRVEDFQPVDFIHEHRVDAHNLARNLVLSSVGRHAWFLSPASGVCKAEWLSPRERETRFAQLSRFTSPFFSFAKTFYYQHRFKIFPFFTIFSKNYVNEISAIKLLVGGLEH
jgi:hypothetical protein